MRFHHILTWILGALLLASCQGEDGLPGPVGPPGPQGPQGADGAPGPLALMYQVDFDLNADNNWEFFFPFPEQDLENILYEDVVLVYLLWEREDLGNGEFLDTWQLMPVSFFTDAGLLQMSYDFTWNDVKIFAEAGFTLDPELDAYNGEIARIVVVPAVASQNARTEINYEDYYEVAEMYGLCTETVQLKKPLPQRN